MKFVEMLIDRLVPSKGGHLIILSFVFGTIKVICFPDAFERFYNKLPFDSISNVFIAFVFVICAFYILLSFLYIGTPNILKKIRRAISRRAQRWADKEAEVNALMCLFDAVPDWQYCVVLTLLKEKNKIPYETLLMLDSFSELSIFSCLCPIKLFDTHSVRHVDEQGSSIIYTAYLLKPNIYHQLKHIYQKYGRLSHANRQINCLED